MAVIKRVDAISLAKIQSVVMAAFGLLLGMFYALLGAALSITDPAPDIGAGFGVFALVMLPLVYGILGFIGGALAALVYNYAAPRIGGIKLEIK